jgi:hypothetical protein
VWDIGKGYGKVKCTIKDVCTNFFNLININPVSELCCILTGGKLTPTKEEVTTLT